MIIESANSPVFRNEAGTAIDLQVKFAHIGEAVPFTASQHDLEQHGKDIFSRAIAGEFGVIAAFVPPSQAQIDEESNAVVMAALREIDIGSIRSIREYIAARGDAPALLKAKDLAAAAERAKLK